MEPLITITLSEYNKMLSQIADKSKPEQNIELALYWAYRVIEDSTLMPEFTKICENANLEITRKGTKMKVERFSITKNK